MTAASKLVGQDRVIATVRELVDAWRGFPLGGAKEAYPERAPRYLPRNDEEMPVSDTTMHLLQHWFRHEPHLLGQPGATFPFKYWPHQRRLVESFIYLYEVRGIRRTEGLYELCGVDPLQPQRDPWAKLGGQLATGSGKTKMMSLLIAWSYLNAVCEQEARLGFGRHSVLIAPGLFVRDRLLADFFPPRGGTPVFFADPVLPPALESIWDLKVYSPATCPMRLDPSEGALVVTNYHQLLRTGDEAPDAPRPREQQTMDMLFEEGEPERLEAVTTPLMERLSSCSGLLVLNDEAHHVGDEAAHAIFEQKQREKAKLGDDAATEMAWIRSIRRLNGSATHVGRVTLQADLSATLFEETGSSQKTAGSGKKAKRTAFKPVDLFRHTVVHYGLPEAIRDEIVKHPVLERVVVKNKKTGAVEDLVRAGQPNAWETYRNLLVTGIERWKKVRDQLAAEGDRRKPILFILCGDRNEAREVANFLKYGEASRADLSNLPPTGYEDPETGGRLFVEADEGGMLRATVVEVHIGQKEEQNETEWERIRDIVNQIDHDELPSPDGAVDSHGRPVMVPNPYNVVVSVMMLKEGWDVRNVKVIVPLRPCDSRTLTEQTLGRGLRKMHIPELDDDGAAEMRREELYVIEHPSFAAILQQIEDLVERKDSDDIVHSREYVPIPLKADLRERQEHGVRLLRFEGMTEIVPDWRVDFDVGKLLPLTPKIAWLEEIADTEIQTFLKEAMARGEEEGMTFTVPEVPSYRDFNHVLEVAYAIPLLRDLGRGLQDRNAVRAVVREFLERKTFALPAGLPISFDRVIEAGDGRRALGNLARSEVIIAVKAALLPPLHRAITAVKPASKAQLSERTPEDLDGYQAIKKHVMTGAPRRSAFNGAAFDSADELRVALLLEQCADVTGWLFNHRSGVNYSIEYDWQGLPARYFPDFIVRARIGEVVHNLIIEVKGRLDDRDKAKAERGRRYCELLTEHDVEPWHYVFMVENEALGRDDITWWQARSVKTVKDLLRRHEGLPLIPDGSKAAAAGSIDVVASVRPEEEFVGALPVHDLAAAAGGFSEAQTPESVGWARLTTTRTIDRTMFLARVAGKSMEPGVPDGSWCLFRAYPAGEAPSAMSLDGRRVVVQLADAADPDTGGRYTVKRWRVAAVSPEGGVDEIELVADNPAVAGRRMRPEDGDLRIIAELLEVIS